MEKEKNTIGNSAAKSVGREVSDNACKNEGGNRW
jgi:hypothetical protein